jgi:hypothetical protein
MPQQRLKVRVPASDKRNSYEPQGSILLPLLPLLLCGTHLAAQPVSRVQLPMRFEKNVGQAMLHYSRLTKSSYGRRGHTEPVHLQATLSPPPRPRWAAPASDVALVVLFCALLALPPIAK